MDRLRIRAASTHAVTVIHSAAAVVAAAVSVAAAAAALVMRALVDDLAVRCRSVGHRLRRLKL